jgi:L-ectoine synthase
LIVKSLDDVIGTEWDVHGPSWNSRRLLLEEDGMGYSLTHTVIKAGARMTLEYKSHFEACYCISGSGSVHDIKSDVTHKIFVGTIYALNKHDRHTLQADSKEDMHLVCIFNPPLTGKEVHQVDGSYALSK